MSTQIVAPLRFTMESSYWLLYLQMNHIIVDRMLVEAGVTMHELKTLTCSNHVLISIGCLFM
jgi:hypothetical protein